MAMPEPHDPVGFWAAVKDKSIDQLWPPDDENVAWQLAEEWRAAADKFDAAAATMTAQFKAAQQAWPDVAGLQFRDVLRKLPENMTALAANMRTLAQGMQDYGDQIREARINILWELGVNIGLFAALMAIPGGGFLAAGLARSVAGRLTTMIVGLAGRSAPLIGRVVTAVTKLAIEIGKEMIDEAFIDAATQLTSMAGGTREHYDLGQTGKASVTGGVGGVFGEWVGRLIEPVAKVVEAGLKKLVPDWAARNVAAGAGSFGNNALTSPSAGYFVNNFGDLDALTDLGGLGGAIGQNGLSAGLTGVPRSMMIDAVQQLKPGGEALVNSWGPDPVAAPPAGPPPGAPPGGELAGGGSAGGAPAAPAADQGGAPADQSAGGQQGGAPADNSGSGQQSGGSSDSGPSGGTSGGDQSGGTSSGGQHGGSTTSAPTSSGPSHTNSAPHSAPTHAGPGTGSQTSTGSHTTSGPNSGSQSAAGPGSQTTTSPGGQSTTGPGSQSTTGPTGQSTAATGGQSTASSSGQSAAGSGGQSTAGAGGNTSAGTGAGSSISSQGSAAGTSPAPNAAGQASSGTGHSAGSSTGQSAAPSNTVTPAVAAASAGGQNPTTAGTTAPTGGAAVAAGPTTAATTAPAPAPQPPAKPKPAHTKVSRPPSQHVEQDRQPDDAPPPLDPDGQSLGRFNENRLTRSPDGRITHVDKVPVAESLHKLTSARAQEYQNAKYGRKTLPGAKTGNRVALVMDLRSGYVYEHTNGPKGTQIAPSNVHPKLQARVAELRAKNPARPLRHAEVRAANELLHLTESATLSDFLADVRTTTKNGPTRARICPTCTAILADTPAQPNNTPSTPPQPHGATPNSTPQPATTPTQPSAIPTSPAQPGSTTSNSPAQPSGPTPPAAPNTSGQPGHPTQPSHTTSSGPPQPTSTAPNNPAQPANPAGNPSQPSGASGSTSPNSAAPVGQTGSAAPTSNGPTNPPTGPPPTGTPGPRSRVHSVRPVPHSEFRVNPKAARHRVDVEERARVVAVAVAADANVKSVRPLGLGRFLVTRQDGTTFVARVVAGDTTNGNVAEVTVTGTDRVEITVSALADLKIVGRAVANALAQGVAALGRNVGTDNILTGDQHPGSRTDLTAEDRGREAEVRNLERARQETARVRMLRRRRLAAEMRALVEELGVHPDDGGGPQRQAVSDVRHILQRVAPAGSRRPSWAAPPTGYPAWKAFLSLHLVADTLPGLGAAAAITLTGAPLVGLGVGVMTVGTAVSGTIIKRWYGRRDKTLVDTGHGFAIKQRAYETALRRKQLLDPLLARTRATGVDVTANGPAEPVPGGDFPARYQSYGARLLARGVPSLIGAAGASLLMFAGLPLWNAATHWGVAAVAAALGPVAERYLRSRIVSREWALLDNVGREKDTTAAEFDEQFVAQLHTVMDRIDALAGTSVGPVRIGADPVRERGMRTPGLRWYGANQAPGQYGDLARGTTDAAGKIEKGTNKAGQPDPVAAMNAAVGSLLTGGARATLGMIINAFLDRNFIGAEYNEIVDQVHFDFGNKMAEQVALEQQTLQAMLDDLNAQVDAAEAAKHRVQASLPSRVAHLQTAPTPGDPALRPRGHQRLRAFLRLHLSQAITMEGLMVGAFFAFNQDASSVIVISAVSALLASNFGLRYLFRRSEQRAVDETIFADRAKERVVEAAEAAARREFLTEFWTREITAAADHAATGVGPQAPPAVPAQPQVPKVLRRNDPLYPDHIDALAAHEREKMLLEPRPWSLLGPRLLGLQRLHRLAARVREFAAHEQRTGESKPVQQARADLAALWSAYQQLVKDGTPIEDRAVVRRSGRGRAVGVRPRPGAARP